MLFSTIQIFKQTSENDQIQLQKKLSKKTAKYGPTFLYTTKHRMFSLQVYQSPESFTQPLITMVVTFSNSGQGVRGLP